jgi:hypothetical protein
VSKLAVAPADPWQAPSGDKVAPIQVIQWSPAGNALVESGLLERRIYGEHPPRHEYLLAEIAQQDVAIHHAAPVPA